MAEATMPKRRITIDGLGIPVPERRWVEMWRQGDVSCVNVTVAIWENAAAAMSVIGAWKHMLARNADIAALATSAAEVERIAASGRTAIVMGFQNTAPIEHDVELIGAFREAGVCIMQLTYNLQNYIGCGYWEEKDTGVSSRFGKVAIAEMNRVGVLIDLSHCGERTTLEAIEMSEKPVSITHGNPREFVTNPGFGPGRLKTTEAIRALAARGGVIGLSPNRFMTLRGVETTLDEYCEMVAWAADRFGVDHIGVGTDFCPGHPPGIRDWWRYAKWSRERIAKPLPPPHEGWQDWFRSPADFQNLRPGLAARGFHEGEIDQIMGGNFLRLFARTFEPDAVAPPATQAA